MRTRLKRFFLHPTFTWLWIGQTLSTFGSHISGDGLPLAAIQLLQATPLQLSLLLACSSLPVLFLSLIAGAWIDRWLSRPVLLVTDLARACALCLIPLSFLSGWLHIEILYLVAILTSTLSIFFRIAQHSFLPALLSPKYMVAGNSKLGMSDAVAEIAGPPFAGWLIQTLSAPIAILFDAFSFVFSAICLWRIRVDEYRVQPDQPKQVSLWHSITEGLHLMWITPTLRAVALYALTFNFCGGAFATLYTLYVVRTLNLSFTLYGMLVMMGGIGSLLATLLATRLAQHFGMKHTMSIGVTIFGLSTLSTPLAYGPSWLIVTILMLGQLCGDCALTIYAINEISLRQTIVPDHMRGRVNASMHILEQGIGPIGAIVAALFSQWTNNIRLTLLFGAIGMLLASSWIILFNRRERTLIKL